MSKLIYKKALSNIQKGDSYYLLTQIISEGDGVEIMISGVTDGALIINSRAFKIKEGTARIKDGELADGAFMPYINSECGRIPLSPFAICGGRIIPYPAEEYSVVQNELIASLYSRLSYIEEKCAAFEKKIFGETLFKFE